MKFPLVAAKGQFVGKFEVSLDGTDLCFAFKGDLSIPPTPVEGTELHLTLGNLIKPERPMPILDDGFVYLEQSNLHFTKLKGRNVEPTSVDDLLDIARMTGPLFGRYSLPKQESDSNIIREPTDAWLVAAKNLNFAIRAKAVLDGRATDDWLDDELYFMYYNFAELGLTWMAFKYFPFGLPAPYDKLLTFSDAELEKLFVPELTAKGTSAQLVSWDLSSIYSANKPRLRVAGTTHLNPKLPDKRDVYLVSNQYMRSTSEGNRETWLSLVSSMMKSLIELHTFRIRYGWSGDIYALQYGSLLERLWYNVGVGASQGKLGICTHCGRLFNADTERKDRKLYCSLSCQEAAKSKRHYCKRVVRRFVGQAGGVFSIEDILEKHPSLDRASVLEALESTIISTNPPATH